MKNQNLLKQFKPLPVLDDWGNPYFIVLLCARQGSRIRPYAWLENMTRPGKLVRTIVPIYKPITTSEAQAAVTELVGSPDLSQLYQFLLNKAQDTLAEREQALASKGLKYRSSHYADADALSLCRPAIGTQKRLFELEVYREELTADSDTGWDESAVYRPKKKLQAWNWDDYIESAHIGPLIKQLVMGVKPLAFVQGDFPAGHKLYDMKRQANSKWLQESDGRRMVSPKARLNYLIELGSQLTYVKSFPALGQHHFPMTRYTPTQVAKKPTDELLELIAECQTWISFYYLMDISHERLDVRRPHKHWSSSELAVAFLCYHYRVLDDKVVPGDDMIYTGVEDLPELARSFGCEYTLPTETVKPVRKELDTDAQWDAIIAADIQRAADAGEQP